MTESAMMTAAATCRACVYLAVEERRTRQLVYQDHFCTHPLRKEKKVYQRDPGAWMGYEPRPVPSWCPQRKDEG